MVLRLALVRLDEDDQHEIQRPHHNPAVSGRPVRHRRQGEEQEADILRDPRAVAHDPPLPLGPGATQRGGHLASGPRADERRRAWEEPGLPAYVVAVDPGGETFPERARAADTR